MFVFVGRPSGDHWPRNDNFGRRKYILVLHVGSRHNALAPAGSGHDGSRSAGTLGRSRRANNRVRVKAVPDKGGVVARELIFPSPAPPQVSAIRARRVNVVLSTDSRECADMYAQDENRLAIETLHTDTHTHTYI
eukprot:scaffold996_cov43-Prasinocladus_malaysianus.AAC.1